MSSPSNSVSAPETMRYDFGRMSGPWNFSGFPLSGLDVKTASWLDTPAMQYRLEFEDGWRRHSYSKSQWVAPPSALLERFLTRRIIFRQPDPAGKGCHLQFLLHEIEQTFEKQDTSHVTLEVLAMLQLNRGGGLLSKRAFYINKPAPTPDALGSVAATRDAVQSLSSLLDDWLSELEKENPAIANRCRS